jgi:hypothetical protein
MSNAWSGEKATNSTLAGVNLVVPRPWRQAR